MIIKGHEFKKICDFEKILETKNGQLFGYYPQDQYMNTENLKLHAYGKGPFCRFKISETYSMPGVYAFILEGTVVYIGECENLTQRFNTGYGNISPRNCFINGQSTNCRLNSYILSQSKLKKRLELYFHATNDYKKIESQLIRELSPKLNIKDNSNNGGSQNISAAIRSNDSNKIVNKKENHSSNRHSKYNSLYIYLSHQTSKKLRLTYYDLEKLLCFKLPNSAYIYKMWWDNGTESHSQSRAWLNAGFIAAEVKLGEYVIFEKK